MAFIDLEIAPHDDPVEAYDTDGSEIDLVHYKYTRVLLDLLPPGRAFTRRAATRLQKLVSGLGMEFSRLQRGIRQMLREAQPATATHSLALWEKLLGLPDCEEPTTLAGRRMIADAKLGAAAGHTQELDFWEGLFEKLGYQLNGVFNFSEYLADCEDPCDVGLFDELWIFAVWLFTMHGENDAVLECQVEAEQLLGFEVDLKWQWNIVDSNGGATALRAVATSQDGWTVAVGLAGEVKRSKEFLTTWGPIASGVTFNMLAVASAGGSTLVAVGDAGEGCLRSIDGGTTWAQVVFAASTLYGITRGPQDNNHVIAVGAGGEIWKSTDGGAAASWATKVSPVATTLRAATQAAGVVVAVGDDGVIIRSDDTGETWEAQVSGTTDDLFGVSGWGDVLVAVGDAGRVVRSTDGGVTWVATTIDTTEVLRAVVAAPSGRWTACGSSGLIAQSLDGGATWTITTVSTGDLYGASYGALLGRAVLVGGEYIVTE